MMPLNLELVTALLENHRGTHVYQKIMAEAGQQIFCCRFIAHCSRLKDKWTFQVHHKIRLEKNKKGIILRILSCAFRAKEN